MDDDHASSGFVSAAETARLLLELHKENITFVRHYEEIRFKFSQLTVTLAAALVGLSRLSQAPVPNASASLVIPLCIIFLGISGLLITLKYTERADRHATISRTYRRACSDLVGANTSINIEQLHRAATERHDSSGLLAKVMHRVRARVFWVMMHLLLAILGLVMLLVPHPW